MFFTSLMTSLVSSCTLPSAPLPAEAAPPFGSPLKALLRASSLLFCSTETHLGGGEQSRDAGGHCWEQRVQPCNAFARSPYLHDALLLILCLEVVRPVVCREGHGKDNIARRDCKGLLSNNHCTSLFHHHNPTPLCPKFTTIHVPSCPRTACCRDPQVDPRGDGEVALTCHQVEALLLLGVGPHLAGEQVQLYGGTVYLPGSGTEAG